MPVKFRPRVGPFVYTPPRRWSTGAQLAWAIVYLAFFICFIVAVIQSL